jgi:hypothetical protein
MRPSISITAPAPRRLAAIVFFSSSIRPSVAALGVDLVGRFVGLRLEMERQPSSSFCLLIEAVRDWRVDVAGLLRNLDPPILRQMIERPHVGADRRA